MESDWKKQGRKKLEEEKNALCNFAANKSSDKDEAKNQNISYCNYKWGIMSTIQQNQVTEDFWRLYELDPETARYYLAEVLGIQGSAKSEPQSYPPSVNISLVNITTTKGNLTRLDEINKCINEAKKIRSPKITSEFIKWCTSETVNTTPLLDADRPVIVSISKSDSVLQEKLADMDQEATKAPNSK